jgi:hypothetical protein
VKWIKWFFDQFFAPQPNPPYGRAFMWRGLVSGFLMAILLIICLIVLNNPAFLPDNGSKLMPNIVLGIFLIGDLLLIRRCALELRNSM